MSLVPLIYSASVDDKMPDSNFNELIRSLITSIDSNFESNKRDISAKVDKLERVLTDQIKDVQKDVSQIENKVIDLDKQMALLNQSQIKVSEFKEDLQSKLGKLTERLDVIEKENTTNKGALLMLKWLIGTAGGLTVVKIIYDYMIATGKA